MKCSVQNSLAYDTRDRPLLATKGVLLKVAQEYAGLLGDAAFVKHQFDAQVSSFIHLLIIYLSYNLSLKHSSIKIFTYNIKVF